MLFRYRYDKGCNKFLATTSCHSLYEEASLKHQHFSSVESTGRKTLGHSVHVSLKPVTCRST